MGSRVNLLNMVAVFLLSKHKIIQMVLICSYLRDVAGWCPSLWSPVTGQFSANQQCWSLAVPRPLLARTPSLTTSIFMHFYDLARWTLWKRSRQDILAEEFGTKELRMIPVPRRCYQMLQVCDNNLRNATLDISYPLSATWWIDIRWMLDIFIKP